jgi:membrane protein implicated in regulation of membrane protease activity
MLQWWAWITVGALLLGSELTFVNAQFYLVFIGAAGLVVGFLTLARVLPADWIQWSLFALLAGVSLIAFRRRVYERIRRKLPDIKLGPKGETVILPAELPPGATCRLEFRGCSWSAVNGGRSVIAAGGRARIDRVEGLTLVVHADSHAS